jgi:heme-degrading monooxygenase HmoA
MTVARIYIMHASDSAAMEAALEPLADAVRAMDGSEGVEVLRDLGNEKRFIFVEKWVSEEAHAAGFDVLDKSLLGPVGAASDGPPDGAYYDYLKVV